MRCSIIPENNLGVNVKAMSKLLSVSKWHLVHGYCYDVASVVTIV